MKVYYVTEEAHKFGVNKGLLKSTEAGKETHNDSIGYSTTALEIGSRAVWAFVSVASFC